MVRLSRRWLNVSVLVRTPEMFAAAANVGLLPRSNPAMRLADLTSSGASSLERARSFGD
jgi:hypothetical protein